MPRLVATDIAAELRKRISAGEWSESGRIPPERNLADSFGVARNTMRRAVNLLEQDGMVVGQVGRGTFLADVDPNSLAAVVGRMGEAASEEVSVVGCLCTPLDRLGDRVALPPAAPGDVIAIFLAGAYGVTASPAAFLGHPPAAELMVGLS